MRGTSLNAILVRPAAMLLALIVCAEWPGPGAFAQTPAPTPAATTAAQGNCTPSLDVANLPPDQSRYYADGRSYETLKGNYGTSFPNLGYFTGLNCVRTGSALIGIVPTYIAPCAAGSANSPGMSVKPPADDPAGVLNNANIDIESTSRDFRSLVYRLRICDYLISVIAWNTQGRGVPADLTYSWQIGCNSFLNESANGPTVTLEDAQSKYYYAAVNLQGASAREKAAATAAFDQAYAKFVFARYDEFDDLNQRLQSCANVVATFTYSTNTRRFFCNYGGLIGALLTASATAFGKHWGTNSSTQAQVQGLGTVFLAFPALCSSGGAKGKGS
jgi:hypothetical protein